MSTMSGWARWEAARLRTAARPVRTGSQTALPQGVPAAAASAEGQGQPLAISARDRAESAVAHEREPCFLEIRSKHTVRCTRTTAPRTAPANTSTFGTANLHPPPSHCELRELWRLHLQHAHSPQPFGYGANKSAATATPWPSPKCGSGSGAARQVDGVFRARVIINGSHTLRCLCLHLRRRPCTTAGRRGRTPRRPDCIRLVQQAGAPTGPRPT